MNVLTLTLLTLVGLALGSLNARADTIFVSNVYSNTLQRFDLATGAELGALSNTNLHNPQGIAIDRAGNVYVANVDSNTIEKFSPTGADLGVFASAGLHTPASLAFDSADNLYVANPGNHNILRFTPRGVGSVFTSDGLVYPWGLAFDSDDNLFVSDLDANRILRFTPVGAASVFGVFGIDGPLGLAFDVSGNLYTASFYNNKIVKFTPDGAGSVFSDTGSGGPFGVAFDRAGNLYVSYIFGDAIEQFSWSGTDLGVFAHGTLNGPVALAIDPRPEFTGKVTGGGTVDVLGGRANFGFVVRRPTAASPITGNLQYSHPSGAIVRSVTFDTFALSGNSATFGGTCTYDGAPCTFSVRVEDNGEPGVSDSFEITITPQTGTDGGTLRSGTIQIHKE
jgi:sugar lactone lactonase YvrE